MSPVKSTRSRLTLLAPLVLTMALLALTGCPPQNCVQELQKAQNLYNDASRSLLVGVDLTAQQKEQYQQTVTQVEKNALPCLNRDDLKVNAYAIDAFAKWRLGDYTGAITAADQGKSIYEKGKLTTNPRDYAMLSLTPGLVLQSDAHREYRNRLQQGAMTPAEARQISQKMDRALKEIDAVNTGLSRDDPLAVYANQQQLLILWDQINLWSKGVKEQRDWEPEVRKSLQRSEEVIKKFPPGDYPGKSFTQDMARKFTDIKQSLSPSS